MKNQLEPNIKNDLEQFMNQLNKKEGKEENDVLKELLQIIKDINVKETKLNDLIDAKNKLNELENQLRHIKKKNNAYKAEEFEKKKKFNNYKKYESEKLKFKIGELAKYLVLLNDNKKINIFNKILIWVHFKKSVKKIKEDGILMHLLLEEYYLTNLIKEKKRELESENFDNLKEEIKNLYIEKYIPISVSALNKKIRENTNQKLIKDVIEKIQNIEQENSKFAKKELVLQKTKNDLLRLYPVVLTTVDSVISNYWEYLYNNKKVDYIIIDESSQCDILSALPLLHLAKNIIIVGDQKQLSAITNSEKCTKQNDIEDKYNYVKENFLSSIVKTVNPPSIMLLEHYRCNYNIINYCNKFFYDNKLKIYNDAKKDAMSLLICDKGKYVQVDADGYKNEREIKSISDIIQNDINDKFIITPFKSQADILREKYGKERCGTIHTFQGKGANEVYFSSVLNKTTLCIAHLKGKNNLFTEELINVAVSRAKEKFVLVTDANFFKKYDNNMKNLIKYMEIYGEQIPEKTVCIFDYLYKQIPTYNRIIPNIDNPFEEKIFYLLLNFLRKKEGKYQLAWKLPLAEFVTDEKFLKENEELKKFILNNSHLDFSLYEKNINRPILAIEVDGESHDIKKQMARDKKKEEILQYMEIPILRISSKVAWSENDFEDEIERKILLNIK